MYAWCDIDRLIGRRNHLTQKPFNLLDKFPSQWMQGLSNLLWIWSRQFISWGIAWEMRSGSFPFIPSKITVCLLLHGYWISVETVLSVCILTFFQQKTHLELRVKYLKEVKTRPKCITYLVYLKMDFKIIVVNFLYLFKYLRLSFVFYIYYVQSSFELIPWLSLNLQYMPLELLQVKPASIGWSFGAFWGLIYPTPSRALYKLKYNLVFL